MQVTNYYKECALRAAKGLVNDVYEVPIPEMDGFFVSRRGESKYPESVQVVLRDGEGNEFEIYTNGVQ